MIHTTAEIEPGDSRSSWRLTISTDGLTFLLSFLASLVIWGGLSAVKLRFLKLDTPNERSIHPFPIPRSGRLAIIMGGWLGWTSIPSFPLVLFLYTLGLSMLSWLDDKFAEQ